MSGLLKYHHISFLKANCSSPPICLLHKRIKRREKVILTLLSDGGCLDSVLLLESVNPSPPSQPLSLPLKVFEEFFCLTWFSVFLVSDGVWEEVFHNEGVKVCLLCRRRAEGNWPDFGKTQRWWMFEPLSSFFTPKCRFPAGGRCILFGKAAGVNH